MPIICFKNKLKIDGYEEVMSIAFNCEYDDSNHLKIKDYNPNYFDSGDFRIKIEDSIKKFDRKTLSKYDKKNKGILHLAIINYFLDQIPSIYSIRFESKDGDSIYYSNEIKNW